MPSGRARARAAVMNPPGVDPCLSLRAKGGSVDRYQDMTRDFTLLAVLLLCGVLSGCPGRPNRPPSVAGCHSYSHEGVVDSSYDFYIQYYGDPDGDAVALRFDWGDGDTSEWSNYLPSPPSEPPGCPPAPFRKSHSWSAPDTYYIRAQAKDEHEAVSDWSEGYRFVVVSSRIEFRRKEGGW